MRSIAASKLTHTYLERPARDNYVAIALAAVIIIISTFWIGFHIGGNRDTALFTQIMYIISAALGMLWVFRVVYMAQYGPVRLERQHQLAWLLVALGLSVVLCGRIFFLVLSLMEWTTFPSIADVFLNLFYPLVLVAVWLMPSTVRFRARMFLDTLLPTLSFLGVWWFFVIGPVCLLDASRTHSVSTILALIVGLIYFGWDILLALTVILFFLRRSQRVLSPSILLFGIALLLNIFSGLALGYTSIFKLYGPGMLLIDLLHYSTYLLLGLSGLYQYAALARKKYADMLNQPQGITVNELPSLQPDIRQSFLGGRVFALLIHLPLIFLLALTIYGEIVRNDLTSSGLVMLTAVAAMLMSTRHILVSHENEELLLEREQRHEESERLRHMMTQLTEILSQEGLRECIVNMVTHELDFDAVMLLLMDNQRTLEQPPRIQVYTAVKPSEERLIWSFQGDNSLDQLASSGKVEEVDWEKQHLVPPEVRLWCREQHVSEMVFLPLTYQGRILGSLGVMRRSKVRLSRHDISLLRKYTEQVTAVIEHARLYKEAREHEDFSRAMATIATRLNAAVVEPAEIGLVICKEGANILHADYAFFYRADDERHLKPLAAYMRDLDAPLPLDEWPLIHSYEYEAQALHTMQPILLHIPSQEIAQKKGISLLALAKPELSPRKSVSAHLPSSREAYGTPLRVRLAQYYIQTVILAPIVANGEPIGLLIFARSQPPGIIEKCAFTHVDLPQMQDFVEQAAVPFINAQLYQDLQTAHQRLQELDQLKDQFMVTASHELRTPLTAVQGYIELLAQFDEHLPSEQRRDFLQKARRGCDELVVMLGNVMDASRLEAEAGIRPALLKRVSIQETVESVLVLIEPQVTQEEREVYIHIQPRLFALADPARLRQVLMNISVNALKYSFPQSPIAFHAQAIMDQNEPCVLISISDKGKGISPEDQAQLFQRFVRLESDVNSPIRGSGLGLYISRRLIEAMGGKIWIESKGIPGEGSTFHIQLPAAR
ncbi:MAG: GAF domain-containing protein [Ktedonobacteraceae bacterium]|nr:GAF domain-containing protein [Ktedonobacteraceae bacterium]